MTQHGSVFINCPFDDDYKPLFTAILFTVAACGFRPRTALEASNGLMRFDRLCELIRECDLGIHDLSRTESSPDGLPRFNMPFELGLFLGAQAFGAGKQKDKRPLVLVKQRHVLAKFLSDLAGVDPAFHNDDRAHAVKAVRKFLQDALTHANGDGAERLPGAALIGKRLREFEEALPAIADSLGFALGDLNPIDAFADYIWAVIEYLDKRTAA